MKWTLVTGAAKGLGAEISRTLAKEGHSLLLHYNKNGSEAGKLAQECRHLGVGAICLQGDFSSASSVSEFLERVHETCSDLNGLVNNVGIYKIGSALNTSGAEWNTLFQVNLHAPFALIQSLVPSLIKRKGAVINIGFAGIGSGRAETYSAAYSLSKGCLWELTKSLAKELASSGVRVNMVSPGHMENSIDLPEHFPSLPLKRTACFSEVARAVSFLLDDASEYITGQNLAVAGGVRL